MSMVMRGVYSFYMVGDMSTGSVTSKMGTYVKNQHTDSQVILILAGKFTFATFADSKIL